MDTKRRYSILYLAVLGIILSSYLLYNFFVRPAVPLCTINSTINCDAVISGAVSKTLGIPTALYGLIGYITILVATLKNFHKLAFYMAAFGTIFCLRITFIEIFVLKTICPVCLLCQIVMLALLVLTFPPKVTKSV